MRREKHKGRKNLKGHQNGQSEKWAKWEKCQNKAYGSDVYFFGTIGIEEIYYLRKNG